MGSEEMIVQLHHVEKQKTPLVQIQQNFERIYLCWSSDVAHGVGWVCESRMKS